MNDIFLAKLSAFTNVKYDPDKAFYKVMQFNIEDCTSKGITDDDFFDNFYTVIKDAEDNIASISAEIIKGIKFIHIHGYARNGKTTFSHYLEKKIRQTLAKSDIDIFVKRFDFNIPLTDNEQVTFLSSVKLWLESFLKFKGDNSEFQETLDTVIGFTQFTLNNKVEGYDWQSVEIEKINSQFSKINTPLHELASTAANNIKGGVKNWLGAYNRQLKEILSDFIAEDSSLIMTYLIFIHIYHRRKILSNGKGDNKKVMLFLFDNIDDIFSEAAIAVRGNYIMNLCNVFKLFQKYFGEAFKNEIKNFDISSCISFIFQMRSANIVNSIDEKNVIAASLKDNPTYNDFFRAPMHTLSSVQSSIDILKKRYDIYLRLLEFNDKQVIPKFQFFNQILSNTKDDIDFRLSKLFKLWNGNREKVIENFNFEKIIGLIIPANPRHHYLLSGTFLNIFLGPYKSKPELNPALDLFLQANHPSQCNLTRLILTFIYNRKRKDREIKEVIDIYNKGVGLYDILDELRKLNQSGQVAYREEDVISAFRKMFNGQVDDWNQLVTCTKSTYIPGDTGDGLQGKSINLNEEIRSFFKKQHKNSGDLKEKLNKIRILYNDTADYLINDIITHFEFFSLFENGNDCLIVLYRDFLKTYTPEQEYSFIPFINVIKDVFKEVTDILKHSVRHYISDFSSVHPPQEYCEKSCFAISNTFFFALTISRHITYIDQFRNYILNEQIPDLPEVEFKLKVEFNKQMTGILKNYIALFTTLKNSLLENNLELSSSLIDTDTSFKGLLGLIREIESSEYKDFSIMLKKDKK